MALVSACATCSWPIRSANCCGRYRRATTVYSSGRAAGVSRLLFASVPGLVFAMSHVLRESPTVMLPKPAPGIHARVGDDSPAGWGGQPVFLPSPLRGGAGGGVSPSPNPPTPCPLREGGAGICDGRRFDELS